MAIEKTIELYEVLFRFGGGSLIGAHTRHIETVADTVGGEVYSVKETEAAPLALQDVSGYMDNALAGAAEQVTLLTSQRNTLSAMVSTQQTDIDAKASEISSLEVQLVTVQAQLDAMTAERDALAAQAAA